MMNRLKPLYLLRKQSLGFVFFFLSICLFSPSLLSHPIDMGLLTLSQQDLNLVAVLELHPSVACGLAELPADCFTISQKQSLETIQNFLFEKAIRSSHIMMNGELCQWTNRKELQILNETNLTITGTASCKEVYGDLQIKLPFLQEMINSYNLIVKLKIGETERLLGATPANPIVTAKTEKMDNGLFYFTNMGMKHIGLHIEEWKDDHGFHFPEGIDHILFVIALVLASSQIIGLLKTITGFTLGHSITLALASLKLVQIPSNITEILIALSIAFVAAESLWLKKMKSAWRIAFLFGLIHGLGFASALEVVHLSTLEFFKVLVSFNVGVELGQIGIVLISLPIIQLIQKSEYGKKRIIPAMALCIFSAGIYWTIERIWSSL